MTTVTQYDPGTFCWMELATKDDHAARRFYGELFGWTAHEYPMGEGATYVILRIGSDDVAALYENKNMPPNWLSYVSVASVDDAVVKAKSLGGNVINGPMDVPDAGRLAVISDPEGAVIAVWQAKEHIGARVNGIPGTLCWNELETRNREGAVSFYTAMFGWTAKSSPEYVELHLGEKPVGGMMTMPPNMEGVPPHWMPYFLVEDCDASAKKAASIGGMTLVPPMDIPNVGRFAVIRDPQGAVFAIFKPNL